MKEQPAHNEKYFIEAVKKGVLRIDNNGEIFRIAKYYNGEIIKIPEKQYLALNKRGYIHLVINKNGKAYKCFAHRIIWIYHNGDIPDNLEINHKNGIKTDNRLDNLEIITRGENQRHAYKNGLRSRNIKDSKTRKKCYSKLKKEDIITIRKRCEDGEFQIVVALDYDICGSYVNKIVRRKYFSHIK